MTDHGGAASPRTERWITRLAQALSTWSERIEGEGDPAFMAWAEQMIRAYAQEAPAPEGLRAALAAMPVMLSVGDDGEQLVSRALMLELVDEAATPSTPAEPPSLDYESEWYRKGWEAGAEARPPEGLER